MAGVITTGNHPAALWPGVREWFGRNYNEHPTEYTDIFSVAKSTKNYEEDVEVTGFGLAGIKSEGNGVSYDSESQGITKRYTHVAYALGFIVTKEELDDNQYKEKAFRRSKSLAFSMRQTREIVGANVLNRAFTSAYAGGDGKELLATDHPTLDGTQSNELTVAADFSEASLEDLLIQMHNAKNSRGLRISVKARKLIVPPALVFEAQRVLKSELRVGTSDNDLNAMRSMGMLPEGFVVNHYLTDTDAFFVKTDVDNGLMWFDRIATELSNDNDFDTMNAKAKAYMRFSAGWTDWRGLFGSPGS
jgi:hypothetical protein